MDLTKLPKHIKEKYDKKVRGKAIKKVQYDLNKANKSTEDISDTKLEAMVAHKEKEIRASHKEKTWKKKVSIQEKLLIPLEISCLPTKL